MNQSFHGGNLFGAYTQTLAKLVLMGTCAVVMFQATLLTCSFHC